MGAGPSYTSAEASPVTVDEMKYMVQQGRHEGRVVNLRAKVANTIIGNRVCSAGEIAPSALDHALRLIESGQAELAE
jgi:hypothetical protein